MDYVLVLVIGALAGALTSWLLYRTKPRIYEPPIDVVRPSKYTYEVRMDGKTLFPGSGQDDRALAEAKSTYNDTRLPKGRVLEFFTRGQHTASRRT